MRRLFVEQLEDRRLLTTIDLAALVAGQGTTIFGAEADDESGFSVSSAGDVNGDGFDDFVIGAPFADASGNAKDAAGESYVIFGAAALPTLIDLANLGSAGITIFGAERYDTSGFSVSRAGDFNGDGFDDFVIGARFADASGNTKSFAGESYVIFGAASLPATIDLANLGVLGPTVGITIFGADANDRNGYAVSSAGDVNGDGFDDLVVGAWFADASENTKSDAGDSYVIFGASSLPATIDLANLGVLGRTVGITIFGADAGDLSGRSVSCAGDVNGDGFDDLLIGAPAGDASGNAKSDAGDSYVIFGAASLPATINLANLGSAGITIFGIFSGDRTGQSVSSAGDVNGDGFDDLIIGAPSASPSGVAKLLAGKSYVIFGAASLPTTVDLASLSALGPSAGITIFGAYSGDASGSSVSKAGDINGDGFDDLIIGASNADGPWNAKWSSGESYVIFGAASLPATIDLANLGVLGPTVGITIFGASADDLSGRSVSNSGDVNGDGFDDLIIGAPNLRASGNAQSFVGKSYVIFGGNGFTNSILPANLGANTANTITGTAGVEILNGADGHDTILGNGGADILLGGRGNDILAISDLTFNRIVGGSGTDTLRLDGSGVYLNLSTIRDNRIVDIESIDITGSGINGLTLTQREVLNLSSTSNTLIVRRNLGDSVNIGNGWTQGSSETIGPDVFDVFTQGQAVLKLQRTVVIDLAALISGNGTTIFGADTDDRSGISVSSAGDVNGDGFDDFVIGAHRAFALGNVRSYAGESYVIFGGASLPATIDLANLGVLGPTVGITIFGADRDDQIGRSVSSAGDVNGDGFDDLIVGAQWADADGNARSDAGDSYLIFGAALLPATIDLANLGVLGPTVGITIFGADVRDGSGISVSTAGDINGDGFDDLIIGASLADASGNTKSEAGDSYVIFGAASLPATIDLANLGVLGPTVGITIFGADPGDRSGRSVSSAGDVNGDGFDDFIIGANRAGALGNAKHYAGDSYVIFGAVSLPATIDLANLGVLGSTAGITIVGAEAGDFSGYSVSGTGDVNGDGFDDLLIGAYRGDASVNAKPYAGDSYVIFGASSIPAMIDLANLGVLGPTVGITIFGADTDDYSGFSVSSAGDVNGDGFDDFVIGAFKADTLGNTKVNSGETYVIFGGASLPATIDLANLGSAGLTIFGVDADDQSGRSVSSAGDVNGDGFDDLLIGAPYASASENAKSNAGESYLIFGGNGFTNSILGDNLGINNNSIISGTSAAQILNGGNGDDSIAGRGGADVLLGGRGNDILAISDLTFKRIVGGNGTDTLRLDGRGLHLNLTTILDNRIVDIESINLNGSNSGNNTLTLTQREVLNLSSTSNTLLVRRKFGDTVNIGSGWTQGANETIGQETFDVFTQGQAVLKVQKPVVIDLAVLAAVHATTIFGADGSDSSGFSVSSAGDVNGDGFDDLLIGAFLGAASGNLKTQAGDSYVIFGGASLPPTIDLATLGQVGLPAGLTIFGADAWDGSGISVSSAGDVNGDGFDDLLVGAHGADASGNGKSTAGDSYVIFGGASLPPTIDLATLGTAGLTIFGAEANDRSGRSVSNAGDINGDGFDDILIGAHGGDASGNGKSNAGDSYVIFGGASLPPTIDLATLGQVGQPAGVTIFGADAGDISGSSVSNAGDVNGDGFDDILIGAGSGDASGNGKDRAGDSYVIFGGASLPQTIDLATLGIAGVTIFGVDAGDGSGNSVSSAGDVNGDGFDDLLIGASGADALGNSKFYAGDSYVIFGAASLPATIDLATLGQVGQPAGVTIFGADAFDTSGSSVSSAGDVNGDGFDDLLIGASGAAASGNGKSTAGDSYVIFGQASLPRTINLSTLGATGVTIFGAESGDFSGTSVSSAGDVNGDGFDDFIIGAREADASGNAKRNAGESYLIFGGNSFTGSIFPTNLGTSVTETITGTAGAEILNGADGNDTLVGNGGSDVLLGGRGADILAVSDLNFQRIIGGNGSDTLRLDGSGFSLNLSSIPDNRILGIETIDITGSGNNTLTLSYREVLNISDESNTLIVRRNLGDIVNIGSGWTQRNHEAIGGSLFEVYRQGQATLKVQAAITASTVVNRQVFYNNASGFGTSGANNSTAVNPINAIDPSKIPLLPGDTTTVTNYTNFSRGLNGIVIDLAGASNVSGIAASSFQFDVWSEFTGTTPNFVPITTTVTVSTFTGGGVGGSDRVKLVFTDQAIQNAWLRITVLANANTGLVANSVFYFGNARFDVTPTTAFPTQVALNALDTNTVRGRNGTDPNNVSNIFDVDKSGGVNVLDTNAVRGGNGVNSLRPFTAPLPPANLLLAQRIDSAFVDPSLFESIEFGGFRRRSIVRRI